MGRAGDPSEFVVSAPLLARRSASGSDLRAARGAVVLVASGVAVQVVLCSLASAEAILGEIAHEAHAARVDLRLERRTPGGVDLVVGPHLA